MVTNIVSSKVIVEAAIRDFNISYQGWINDAIEWIGYGLVEIGVNLVFTDNVKNVTVNNYKHKMFCNAELIIEINDSKGCQINYIKDAKKCVNYFTQDNSDLSASGNIIPFPVAIVSDIDWWKVDGEWFKFSFTDRKVKIQYKSIEQDDEGFPCILDDVFIIEALKWKLICQLLMRGNKHTTIDLKLAMQTWTDKKQQAKNHLNMPTPYQMKDMMRHAITMIPKINRI